MWVSLIIVYALFVLLKLIKGDIRYVGSTGFSKSNSTNLTKDIMHNSGIINGTINKFGTKK